MIAATGSAAVAQKVPDRDRSPKAAAVTVTDLRVDGRAGDLIGTGNPTPSLGWQMEATDLPQSTRCLQDARVTCPGDEQTAYQIRVAESAVGLADGALLWDSGKVLGSDQTAVDYAGPALDSRDRAAWQVRVWDALGNPSDWSDSQAFELGLLDNADWGDARWIEHHTRAEDDPLPLFARAFDVDDDVERARLYVSGVGQQVVSVNGESVTDEVLAPGNRNYQLSSEYRTYDLTDALTGGENVLGVELGHGFAYERRNILNPEVGRTRPYAWWQSSYTAEGELLADVDVGATTVTVTDPDDWFEGGTINVDTGDAGVRLESRVITEIGATSDDGTGTITFEPPLDASHAAGSVVTGSGDNVADVDPAAGAAVSPRLIARLEVSYADGSTDTIVSDRSWRTATGPMVTTAFYSGTDFDDRRVQVGWDEPGADWTDSATRRDGSAMDWQDAGIAPAPNLATDLVARTAPGVAIIDQFEPVEITNPAPGTYVFDFGQNGAMVPRLTLDEALPAGTTLLMRPAESLNADGTVNQQSFGIGGRGQDIFNTYTTSGRAGESYTPEFNYFSMQWVQLEGVPEGFVPDEGTLTGLQVSADVDHPGVVKTDSERVNRVDRMSKYSVLSNVQSVITDTPGREKLSYPADYTMPMGFIHRQVDLRAYLYTQMDNIVEAQSIDDTSMRGNIPLKTPVYDWGYTRRFGDEINWGNAIVLVPWIHYELYGDTSLMQQYWDEMELFVDYIEREKVDPEHIVDAALADWVSAEETSGEITGTWGWYITIDRMAKMAEITGRDDDATNYAAWASDIRDAFNDRFFNDELRRYTELGNDSAQGATQAAQALALDSGIARDEDRADVLAALVELVEEFNPTGDGQPHFSAGTIGMAPVVRALSEGGHDELLWEALQVDSYPSYGYFIEPTVENPDGFTTMGERWTRGSSKTHMILAQIDEWFHAGLGGIKQAPGSVAYEQLVIEPKVVGDLTEVEGAYDAPAGEITTTWSRDDDSFRLRLEVPANTTAEVRVPTDFVDGDAVATRRLAPTRVEDDHTVFEVSSGVWTFGVGLTRDDCMRGGWESFDDPSIRNLGSCIAFVLGAGAR